MKGGKCLVLLCIFLCVFSVHAGSGSTLRIRLKDIGTDRAEVNFELYRVGDVCKDKPELYKTLWTGDFPDKAYESDRAAKRISEKLQEKPDSSGATDMRGLVAFHGLEDGVYLIRQKGEKNYGIISPFLVFFPYFENGQPQYYLEAEPKGAVGVQDQLHQKPDFEGSEAICTPIPEKHSFSASAVKTGDDTENLPYIRALVASFFICIFLVRKRGGSRL